MSEPLRQASVPPKPQECLVSRASSPDSVQTPGPEKFGRYFLLVFLLIVGSAFFYMVRIFVVPVILAAVFAGLFYPAYQWLWKVSHGRKTLSALICCLALSLGLMLPASGIANLVAKEAAKLYDTLETRMQSVVADDLKGRIERNATFQKLHMDSLPLQSWLDEFGKKGAGILAAALNTASRETFELICTILVTFFTMFYFFRDGPMLLQRLKALSPLAEPYENELIRRFVTTSRATIRGILLVALIKGALGGLTFWAFGIEAPILWAVVMTFLSIVPVVGPWVVMVPAGGIMMLTGNVGTGVILLLAALAIGSIDNLLEPFLIGREAGMYDLLVFFSMVGGIAVFGVTGFIVGPVIAALFRTLLDIYSIEFSKQLQVLHNLPEARDPQSPGLESQSHAVHGLASHSRP